MTLELHATPQDVMRAVEAFQAFGEARGLAGNVVFGMALALEECASNIVNHALAGQAAATFQIRFEQTASAITIELRDTGPAFDPTLASVGDGRAEDEAAPGGWGIWLVRRHTDAMHYSRVAGENVLCLTKNLDSPAASTNL